MTSSFIGRATFIPNLSSPIEIPFSINTDLVRLIIISEYADNRSWKKVGWLNCLVADGNDRFPLNLYQRLIFGDQLVRVNSPQIPFRLQIVPVYYLPEFTISIYEFS